MSEIEIQTKTIWDILKTDFTVKGYQLLIVLGIGIGLGVFLT